MTGICGIPRLNYPGERQFFITHPYDAIAAPLYPSEIATVIETLADQITAPFDYVIGLDGPALLPALVVSQITGRPLRAATKADLDLADKVCFKEPASVHPLFLYNIKPGRVVIVDDEIRTGSTVISCVEAVKKHGVVVIAVLVPIGSARFDLGRRFKEIGIPLLVAKWHSL